MATALSGTCGDMLRIVGGHTAVHVVVLMPVEQHCCLISTEQATRFPKSTGTHYIWLKVKTSFVVVNLAIGKHKTSMVYFPPWLAYIIKLISSFK